MTRNQTATTRVEEFVSLFKQSETDVYQDLGDVYQHYIDNIEAINDGSFDITTIPHFTERGKPVIHGGVMFGITWGKESELVVVTKQNGEFVNIYGARKAAEHAVDTATYNIQEVVPQGRGVTDEFNAMESAETELLHELGDAIEYLYDVYSNQTVDGIESIDNETVLGDVPHFNHETSIVLLYSMLFGRQWEYSDPGLWVITENGEFDSLHGSNQSVTERELQLDSCTVEAVTPVDNDRQAFTIDKNTLLTD